MTKLDLYRAGTAKYSVNLSTVHDDEAVMVNTQPCTNDIEEVEIVKPRDLGLDLSLEKCKHEARVGF